MVTFLVMLFGVGFEEVDGCCVFGFEICFFELGFKFSYNFYV